MSSLMCQENTTRQKKCVIIKGYTAVLGKNHVAAEKIKSDKRLKICYNVSNIHHIMI